MYNLVIFMVINCWYNFFLHSNPIAIAQCDDGEIELWDNCYGIELPMS